MSQGFDGIIITVSYGASVIMDYFGDGTGISRATGKPFNAHIRYFEEKTPLGNAGALYKLDEAGILIDDFLLLNADSVFNIDVKRFVKAHEQNKEHGVLVTLFTHPNSHPYDSGLLITDNNVVRSWLTKEDERPQWHHNSVNAGLHVINKEALRRAAFLSGICPERIGDVDSQTGKTIKSTSTAKC